MRPRRQDPAPAQVREHIRPLTEDAPTELVERLARHPVVLIGEASHGTEDFYRVRAQLTRRLIEDHGYAGVAIEGDWPDAAQVDRWLRGEADHPDADTALSGFSRFPLWMWRNRVMEDFVAWAREHNDAGGRARLFGLDLYSLHRSIDEVITFLEDADPDAAERARDRYACFDHTSMDGVRYGYSTSRGLHDPCEDGAVAQLMEMAVHRDGAENFSAEQNARLVADAERYYRAMYRGRNESWNLRDQHMGDTLDAVRTHLAEEGRSDRVVVWAHNSHLGDARATEMARRGELNLGQLARQRYGDDAALVGLTTHTGEVTAASDWDGPLHRKRVRDSLPGSIERVLHEVGEDRFWLDLHHQPVRDALSEPRLERMIGVIYRPESERVSHYVEASVTHQFDVLLHIDRTEALEPLEPTQAWKDRTDPPETYPWAV